MKTQTHSQINTTKPPTFMPVQGGLLQRKCACGNHTVAGGECEACSKKKNGLQWKLSIGASNDPLELEADRIADQVMATPLNSAVNTTLPRIQRFTGQSSEGESTAPASVDQVLASSGRPLEPTLRQNMEQRFGHNFSQVRVHAGGAAEQSAREVNANAYTVGHNIVFGAGQYVPGSTVGRRLIAHELTHVVQQTGPHNLHVGQSAAQHRPLTTPPPILIQRDKSPPKKDPAKKSPVEKTPTTAGVTLSQTLLDLVNKNVKDYVAYKAAIAKSKPAEKQAALNPALLTKLKDTLDYMSFARCVEALGRKPPTFDELRNNSVVAQAITDAWNASDVGANDPIAQAHEEGGWVFMNLIDGSLSIERAKATGTNFIQVEPPPAVADSVLVAIFHTHPHPRPKPGPSSDDLKQDKRRGVPNLVAASTVKKPKDFQIFLSGPSARTHLASDATIPGPSGGVGP